MTDKTLTVVAGIVDLDNGGWRRAVVRAAPAAKPSITAAPRHHGHQRREQQLHRAAALANSRYPVN